MPNPVKDEWDHRRKMARRARRLEEYQRGLRPFAVAVWEITKEHNLGSLIRTAHATAAAEILLVGGRDWDPKPACTSELYTSIIQVPDFEAFWDHVHHHGYCVVAVELHERAENLFAASYPEKPCFLLGAERGGLPEEQLDRVDSIVQIPQWGLIPSLNLAVAGSIVVYDYLAKLHRRGEIRRPHGGLIPD